MDPYSFSLALGGAGLGVMGAIGLGHLTGGAHGSHGASHGHGAHGGANGGAHGGHHALPAHDGTHVGHAGHAATGAHAHAGPAHAGHAHAGHAHAAPGHAAHGHHASSDGALSARTESTFGDLATRTAWSLLSPRVMFSVLVGFGAAGMLLGHVGAMPSLLRLALAVVGGIAFERFAVGPLWNRLLDFASRPAMTLEQAIFDEAQAVSRFDERGQGLVALELDGQVVQVLATLRADDRAAGVRVRAGDRVRVEEVDVERHRCVVTRVG